MNNQVFNPYLPGWEYIPDGEPHVFEGRLYIFGSHDQAGGNDYCLNDYVAWSTPEINLAEWRFEGVIYRANQHPNATEKTILYAPDVACGIDNRYYLYYSVANSSILSVAVSDTPSGAYEYLGDVRTSDGHILGSAKEDWFQFDPAILVDTDGRIWLYSGSGQRFNEQFGHPVVGCFVMELEQDMLTVKDGPKLLLPADEKRNKPNFFEGVSVRHVGDLYYLVYPTTNLTGLNYATSRFPDRDFVHRGPIHSSSDIGLEGRSILRSRYPIGNSHGGLVCALGQWYIFDHRMTNRTLFSRQGVAEPVEINADGTIEMVESTSCGLNGKALHGLGEYPCYIACNLTGRRFLGRWNPMTGPYITQDEPDFEPGDSDRAEPLPYIRGLRSGCHAGFKYFDLHNPDILTVTIRGNVKGVLLVRTCERGPIVAKFVIKLDSNQWQQVTTQLNAPVGKQALYFLFHGRGVLDFRSFGLSHS